MTNSYPRSCMEVLQLGVKHNGVYTIEPQPGKRVKTYCNLQTDLGGWTLLTNVVSRVGWSLETVKERSSYDPLNSDFSIFGLVDVLKDPSRVEVSLGFHNLVNGPRNLANQYGVFVK